MGASGSSWIGVEEEGEDGAGRGRLGGEVRQRRRGPATATKGASSGRGHLDRGVERGGERGLARVPGAREGVAGYIGEAGRAMAGAWPATGRWPPRNPPVPVVGRG